MKKIYLIVGLIGHVYAQSPFKVDSVVVKFFANESVKTVSVEVSDSNKTTRISEFLSKPSFVNITESQTLVDITNAPFLSSIRQNLNISALRYFRLNAKTDTLKGLSFSLRNVGQYLWNDRVAYMDYEEIPVFYVALGEIVQLWKSWSGKQSNYERYASYRAHDNIRLSIRQLVGEKNIIILISIGYISPVIIDLEPEELFKIKYGIEKSISFFKM